MARGVSVLRQEWSNLRDDAVTVLDHVRRRQNPRILLRQRQTGDFNLLVRANEDVGRTIYIRGEYEADETDCLKREIRPNDVCVDVGANIGYYTMLMASLARQGTVHAFEPVALNFHILSTNAIINGFSNVAANHCAVADHDGEVAFVVSQDSAFSSLQDTGRRPAQELVRVPSVTLDTYVDRHCADGIDCLKVDVEGAEMQVLRGACKLLQDSRRRPRLIMLEMFEPMLRQFQSSVEEIVNTMRAYGYHAFFPQGGREYPFDPQQNQSAINVFFRCTP